MVHSAIVLTDWRHDVMHTGGTLLTLGTRAPCESAWNKDPVFGVIGIQSGPPGRWVHSGFRGGYGGQVGDAGSGYDREDPSGVFRPEQADQDDLPRFSGVAKGRAQGDPVAGDRVSL